MRALDGERTVDKDRLGIMPFTQRSFAESASGDVQQFPLERCCMAGSLEDGTRRLFAPLGKFDRRTHYLARVAVKLGSKSSLYDDGVWLHDAPSNRGAIRKNTG